MEIELLRGTVEHLPAGLMLFRAVRNAADAIIDFEWLLTNPAAVEVIGRSDAEMRGKRLLDELPVERHAGLFDRLVRVVETGVPDEHEFHYARAGVDRCFANHATKLGDGVSVLIAEVSERRRVERERQGRWELVHGLFMQAPFAISVVQGPEHRYVLANPAYERMIGQQGITGKSFGEVFPNLTPDAPVWQMLDGVRATGVPFTAAEFEAAIDGTPAGRRYFQFTCSRICDESGVAALQTVAVDITEQVHSRQRAEAMSRALARNERRFAATFANAAVGIAHISPTGRWLRFNDRVAELLGASREALEHLSFQNLTHPEDLAQDRALSESLLRGEIPSYTLEKRCIQQSGRSIWVNLSASLVRNDDGRPLFFVAIIQDISERKAAEAALREADQQKDEFLAVLSHELRNPLAAIRSACVLLQRIESPDPLMPRIRNILGRQTRHMAHLLDELLDLARVTSGKLTIVPSLIDLAELTGDVLADLDIAHDAPASASASLSVALPEQPVWVNGDRVRLTQVIQNLLSNAVKYTPAEGSIELRLATTNGRAALTITDTGIGLDQELYERLFRPFEQGPQDSARSAGGLGLGLSLSKSIVELHNGTITACSAGRDRGSVFEVQLPLAVGVQAQKRASTVSATGNGRVMIIEDNEDAAELLAALLRARRFEVELASRGEDALQFIRGWRPDAIICDIGLPDIDGYTVARLIRADPSFAGVKLVALSGYGQAKDRLRAAEAPT